MGCSGATEGASVTLPSSRHAAPAIREFPRGLPLDARNSAYCIDSRKNLIRAHEARSERVESVGEAVPCDGDAGLTQSAEYSRAGVRSTQNGVRVGFYTKIARRENVKCFKYLSHILAMRVSDKEKPPDLVEIVK